MWWCLDHQGNSRRSPVQWRVGCIKIVLKSSPFSLSLQYFPSVICYFTTRKFSSTVDDHWTYCFIFNSPHLVDDWKVYIIILSIRNNYKLFCYFDIKFLWMVVDHIRTRIKIWCVAFRMRLEEPRALGRHAYFVFRADLECNLRVEFACLSDERRWKTRDSKWYSWKIAKIGHLSTPVLASQRTRRTKYIQL